MNLLRYQLTTSYIPKDTVLCEVVGGQLSCVMKDHSGAGQRC